MDRLPPYYKPTVRYKLFACTAYMLDRVQVVQRATPVRARRKAEYARNMQNGTRRTALVSCSASRSTARGYVFVPRICCIIIAPRAVRHRVSEPL